MSRSTALVAAALLAALVALPAASAQSTGVTGGVVHLTNAQAAQLIVVTTAVAGLVFLAGLGYMAWRTRRGHPPDKSWTLVVLGMLWVFLSVGLPPSGMGSLPMRLAGAGVLLGAIGVAWWIVAERLRGRWRRLLEHRWSLAVGAVGFLSFLGLYAAGTHMVFQPTPWEASYAGSTPYAIWYTAYGPVTFWPTFEYWIPSLNLAGSVNPATFSILLTLSSLFGLALALYVNAWQRNLAASARPSGSDAGVVGGSTTLMGVLTAATNGCSCCVGALYPVLVGILGSAASPLLGVLGSHAGVLYSVAQVANLWVVVLTVSLAARRLDLSCSLPTPDEGGTAVRAAPGDAS